MKPGTVLWVDFSPQIGREQAGRRPAIVVGSDMGARIWAKAGLLLVVPCTTTVRGLHWQPQIMLDGKPGAAMCEQLRTISVRRVVGVHRSSLSGQELTAIVTVLRRMTAF